MALQAAFLRLVSEGALEASPLTQWVSAISVGVVDGESRLDLEYIEDAAADVDLNVVCLEEGGFVEVQGTAEGAPFDREELDRLLDLADKGVRELRGAQKAVSY